MQRSIINQKPVTLAFYIIFFIIYESISNIYLILPPLFGVLFVFFMRKVKQDNALFVFSIAFCLMVYEADKGYLAFSSIVYFSLLYKFVIPKIVKNFGCESCIRFTYILLAYVGFYLFSSLIATAFELPEPLLSNYILYYIVIEFFIVSML
ncbi:MAG: hypothetical protein A2019_00235 [Sulfurimonas sp. GWF2_37_8]|nr:MAG: hypothetical protein A2019_00235 [Sulfurimonas sp. GWF2_37_8]